MFHGKCNAVLFYRFRYKFRIRFQNTFDERNRLIDYDPDLAVHNLIQKSFKNQLLDEPDLVVVLDEQLVLLQKLVHRLDQGRLLELQMAPQH